MLPLSTAVTMSTRISHPAYREKNRTSHGAAPLRAPFAWDANRDRKASGTLLGRVLIAAPGSA